MKKTLCAVLMFALLSIPACAAFAEAGNPYIPLISKGFQHQFWKAVAAGASQAAADYDVDITFEGPDDETQVDQQLEMLRAAIDQGPAALCLAALNSTICIPMIEECVARGIPIIGFDSGVDSDNVTTTCATDNRAAAAAAADKLAELIGKSGKIAIIAHDETSRTGIDRRDGFVERIEEEYPSIQIVDIQYGGGDHEKSAQRLGAVLARNPDLLGIFATNEGSSVGALYAKRELGRDGLVLIGFDSGKIQLDAIRAGEIQGAVQQNPVQIGYSAVECAVRAMNGEVLPAFVDTGFIWADAGNLDSPEVQAVIYE